jgi:hypothetical protein
VPPDEGILSLGSDVEVQGFGVGFGELLSRVLRWDFWTCGFECFLG